MSTGLAKLFNVRPLRTASHVRLPGSADPWRLKARLDWQSYFRVFCEQHGDPVVYRNRLLFHDGWQYSMTNHGGPEWPPPDSAAELKTLQRAYWTLKLEGIRQERRKLAVRLKGLRDLQAVKNVPLQQREWDQAAWSAGQEGVKRQAFDFSALENRLAELEYYIAECKGQLNERSE